MDSNIYFKTENQIKKKITDTLTDYIIKLQQLLAQHKQLKINMKELQKKEKDVSSTKREIDNSTSQISILNSEIQQINEKLQNSYELNIKERDELQKQISELQQEKEDIEQEKIKEIRIYESQIAILADEKNELKENNEKLKNEIKELTATIANLEKNNSDNLAKIKELKDYIQELEKGNVNETTILQMENLTVQLERKHQELADKEFSMFQIKEELKKLKTENGKLTQQLSDFENFIDNQLEKFKKNADDLFRQFDDNDDDDETGAAGTTQMQNIGRENNDPEFSSSARRNSAPQFSSSARGNTGRLFSARADTGRELQPFIESNNKQDLAFNPSTNILKFSKEGEQIFNQSNDQAKSARQSQQQSLRNGDESDDESTVVGTAAPRRSIQAVAASQPAAQDSVEDSVTSDSNSNQYKAAVQIQKIVKGKAVRNAAQQARKAREASESSDISLVQEAPAQIALQQRNEDTITSASEKSKLEIMARLDRLAVPPASSRLQQVALTDSNKDISAIENDLKIKKISESKEEEKKRIDMLDFAKGASQQSRIEDSATSDTNLEAQEAQAQAQERAIKAAQKQAAEQKQAAQSLIANIPLSDTSSEEDNQRLALLQPAQEAGPLQSQLIGDSDSSDDVTKVSDVNIPPELVNLLNTEQKIKLYKSLYSAINRLNEKSKNKFNKLFQIFNDDNLILINSEAKEMCKRKDTQQNIYCSISDLSNRLIEQLKINIKIKKKKK